jgi:hypothetical protein
VDYPFGVLEKDMEDLLAQFPEDFFPRNGLVFRARQQSLSDVGRFDLLFEDSHGSTILMEIKARTLKYNDATQVANYRDELRRRGHEKVFMWLVATHIPQSVREFLDDKGIEYTEIHVAEFRRVAEHHDLSIAREDDKPEPRRWIPARRPIRPVQHRSSRVVGPSLEFRPQGPVMTTHEWTMRDLAKAENVSKSTAWRRVQAWLKTGKIEQTSRHRTIRGGMAHYRLTNSSK